LLSCLFALAVLPAHIFALPALRGSVFEQSNAHSVSPILHASSTKRAPQSFNFLFPDGEGHVSWSTATGTIKGAVPLTVGALNPLHIGHGAAPVIGAAPDGSTAVKVNFPAGSYDYQGPNGGVNFYSNTGLNLSNAREVTSSYSVLFAEGFEFNQGGKLPGLYGGDDPSIDIGCSGHRRDKRCFSVRYMWRENGQGELYAYLPRPDMGPEFKGNEQICNVPPLSVCSDLAGASVGRGSWTFTPGKWTVLSQRVKLNDAGAQNGELEVTVDGQTMFSLNGLAFTDSENGRIDGYIFQSFFGGHHSDWASPKDQDMFLRDFSVAITQYL